MQNDSKNGIQQAVEKAGGPTKLANLLGVSRQYIHLALRQGYVSPSRAVEIEAQMGISRNCLVDPKLVRLLDLQACA